MFASNHTLRPAVTALAVGNVGERRTGAAGGPPTDWGELVQVHEDRAIFQASTDDLPAIDINRL